MSYSTHEPLADVVSTLRHVLPGLRKLLRQQVDVPTLHPAVESISILLARHDRGEIVERPPVASASD